MMTEVKWSGIGTIERDLIETRDLLGGGGGSSNPVFHHKEIDIDVQPPHTSGWEKHLDLKSGNVYFHPREEAKTVGHISSSGLQDLNFPPREEISPFEERKTLQEHNFLGLIPSKDTNNNLLQLDLKLSASSQQQQHHQQSSEWQSVCTLEKVKLALDRAEKEAGKRKQSSGSDMQQYSNSSSSTTMRERSPSTCSTSSLKQKIMMNSEVDNNNKSMALDVVDQGPNFYLAAGCPRCLLYVLLPKTNPKCPRCGCIVGDELSSSKRPRLSDAFHSFSPRLKDDSSHFDLNRSTCL